MVPCNLAMACPTFHDMSHGSSDGPYVAMDLGKARRIAADEGAETEKQTAAVFGLSDWTWTRLTRGRSGAAKARATADIIARVLAHKQDLKFYDLFRVVSR